MGRWGSEGWGGKWKGRNGKIREGEGEAGLCSSKNSFKSPGHGPSLTLRQIDAPV